MVSAWANSGSESCGHSNTSLFVGNQWADFGPRPHYAKDRVASDHADDVCASVFAIVPRGYYGHLIDIRGQQALQEAEQRLVRFGPQNFVALNHHRLHR